MTQESLISNQSANADLSGRTALITGATRGIGRATAITLAKKGAAVVVVSRKAAAVEETTQAIQNNGGEALGISANVSRMDELQRIAEESHAFKGRIDILVNNAGANPVYGGVEETTPEAYAKIMDVNVRAPFELAKRLFPYMKEAGSGAIVNISSVGGISPETGLGIYSVSKAAIISLTQVMAKEWGKYGIRANAVCPGYIQTDFSRIVWESEARMHEVMAAQPIQRLGTPQDVANLINFLVSDAASFCTGGVYMVDGGYTI